MEYKHKSGAQKRKEKVDKIENAKIGSRTLFQVGISKEGKPEFVFPVIPDTPTPVDFNEINMLELQP